ncbi:hypothetical protein D3C72_2420070 [compost metagenome]
MSYIIVARAVIVQPGCLRLRINTSRYQVFILGIKVIRSAIDSLVIVSPAIFNLIPFPGLVIRYRMKGFD